MISDKIIEEAINEIMKESNYVFSTMEIDYVNKSVIASIGLEEDFKKNKKTKLEFKKTVDVKLMNLGVQNSKGTFKLELLLNLLDKKIDIKEIKKLSFEMNRFFANWNEIINLVKYVDTDKNNKLLTKISRKYKSKINNDDLFYLCKIIEKDNNAFNVFLDFYKNTKELLKINQKNYIKDIIEKNYYNNDITQFDFSSESEDMFEDREDNFEYLNIKLVRFMEKNTINKTYVWSVSDYEKIAKDIIALIKSNKKDLGINNINFQNRVTKENNFLIIIEKEDNFKKEEFKFVFTEYMKKFFEEINKSELEDPDEQNFFMHRRFANNNMKKNNSKIFEYLMMKRSMNKDEIKIRKNKI